MEGRIVPAKRNLADPLARAEKMAAEIIAIADDTVGDYVEKENAKGKLQMVPDRENIARAKLRIDVRMWLMARLAPQVYGTGAAKPGQPAPEPFGLLVDLGEE
jgi:hypothetical protein